MTIANNRALVQHPEESTTAHLATPIEESPPRRTGAGGSPGRFRSGCRSRGRLAVGRGRTSRRVCYGRRTRSSWQRDHVADSGLSAAPRPAVGSFIQQPYSGRSDHQSQPQDFPHMHHPRTLPFPLGVHKPCAKIGKIAKLRGISRAAKSKRCHPPRFLSREATPRWVSPFLGHENGTM